VLLGSATDMGEQRWNIATSPASALTHERAEPHCKRQNLSALIKKICALSGLQRLRLSSIDPWAVNDEFLDVLAECEILCDHFHLSLQSGCDKILTAMNRRYTSADYTKAAEILRKIRPEAALTTDIIVGFPGETDEDFLESLDFVGRIQFARVHVFEYSAREGTPAASFSNQVTPAVKSARGQAMRQLAAEMQQNFLQAQVGKTMPVLFESQKKSSTEGCYIGHSSNYCPVEVFYANKCTTSPSLINTIQNVLITQATGETLVGQIS